MVRRLIQIASAVCSLWRTRFTKQLSRATCRDRIASDLWKEKLDSKTSRKFANKRQQDITPKILHRFFFDFVNRGKQLRPTLLTGYWSLEPTAVRWTGLFVIMPTTMPRNMVGKRCWRFLRDTSSPQCIHIRYVHHCLWGRFSTFLRPEVSKSSLQTWGQILWQLRMRKTSGCKFAGEQVCERRQ